MRIQLSDHFSYKMLLRFVLPSIVMMVFTSIYGVVDGLFVSNFVGKTPFAAVNLVMPFIMIFGGIGFMFGTGGSALVAKTMGEGDKARANRYFTMMIAVTLICGVIISVVGVIFMEPISIFLGADEEMLADCVLYGRIVLAFNTAFMLQNVFQSFLIAAEKPKLGLWVTVAAGVTNMALDALFMAVFHWGVAAYGVLMYVEFIFAAVFIGYAIGCAPIVSYHFGAGNRGELKNLLKKSVLLMGTGGLLMVAVAQGLAGPMARLFVGYDDGLCAMTVHAFRISTLAFVLVGFNIFASSFFTALNDGVVSAVISFLRTFVFKLSAVLLLPLIWELDGIWWAEVAAEICAFALSAAFLLGKRKKYGYL